MFALNICIETVHNISSFSGWKAAYISWKGMLWTIKLYLGNLMKTVRSKVWLFLFCIFYTDTSLLNFFSPVIMTFSALLSRFSICQSHKCSDVVTVFDKITCSLPFISNPCLSTIGLRTSQLTLIFNLLIEKCGYKLLICVCHWETDLKWCVLANLKWGRAVSLLNECFEVFPKMLPSNF